MTATWAAQLEESVKDLADSKPVEGVWSQLTEGLNPNERRPKQNPHVVVRELKDRRGPYYILKNTLEKTYIRLSPDQYRIWQLMDGEHSVQELIVEHYMATGAFAHAMIARLVEELSATQMLDEHYQRVWSQVREKVEQRSFLGRLSSPAQFFLTQKLSINNLDPVITALYRAGGWLFFTRPMQVLYLVLSVGGLFAFSEVLKNPAHEFIGDNFVQGVALIWLASILPVLIHELGHALTVKHYGREVPRGGLMLFFGMPAAFVETTDIWMEPRRARLAVTWNGPYTGLIIGGGLSLVLYFFPDFFLNSFFFKMIGFAYATVFMNVNPLLKYDGYYLLSDALEISSLRERSMNFLRKHFLKRLLDRKRFTRDEVIETVYGILSILWTGYALYLMSFFWRTRVQESLKVVMGSGYSWVARLFSVLVIAGIGSFVVLIALGLVRLAQAIVDTFIRSGGLTRHGRLALYYGLLAAGIGFGLTWLIGPWASLVAGMVMVVAGWLVLHFSAPFSGSLRGGALWLIAGALAAFGAAEGVRPFEALTGSVSVLRWAGVGLLLAAGLLLVVHSLRQIRALLYLAPAVLAVAVFLVAGQVAVPIQGAVAAGLIAALGSLTAIGLSGGARSPASALAFGGAALYVISWDLSLPVGDPAVPAALLVAAGGLHWVTAQLPYLSQDPSNVLSARTQQSVRLAVATIVRRVIAQMFFETGWRGVNTFGREFNRKMEGHGLKLGIDGNRFIDEEFEGRTVVELTDLYGIAFDELHLILCRTLGEAMGTLTFNYGLDRLPWQNREVILELVLSRSEWSEGISERHAAGKDMLLTFLKRVPLFVFMDNEELAQVAAALDTEHFPAGGVIMREGDPGDKFYIIERGSVSFWRRDADGNDELLGEKGSGQFFGEVALVSEKPRNATVIAETPLTVLTLSREGFDQLVREHVFFQDRDAEIVKRSWLLRSMPIFDELESVELDWLAASMEKEVLPASAVLFKEGDPGDRFYIVEEGELIVSHERDGEEVEITRVRRGEYVGEIALLLETPRTATITAAVDTTLLSLEGDHFLDLVSGYPMLQKILTKTGTRRQSYIKDQLL